MKNEKHKGVREMPVARTKRDKGYTFTITGTAYDDGMWEINGDPCQDDLTAARLVAECLESVADRRDHRKAA